MVQKRRWDLYYKLTPDYKDLAKKVSPFSEFLLGDNIKDAAIESRKECQIAFRANRGIQQPSESTFFRQKVQSLSGFPVRVRFQP